MATSNETTALSRSLQCEGVQNQEGIQPKSQTGKLSRYQVVLNDEKGLGISSNGELGVYAEAKEVSIFERIINYFTGALTKEKNEAMIDFIGTGTLKVLEKDEKGNALLADLENLTPGVGFNNRLRVFKSVMDGSTGATIEQKNKAVDALIAFIEKQGDPAITTKAQESIAKHGIEHTALKEALSKDIAFNSYTTEAVKPLVKRGIPQDLGANEFFEIDLGR